METQLESPPSAGIRVWRMLRGWLAVAAVVAAGYLLFRFVLFRPEPVEVRVSRVRAGTVEETVSSTKAGSVRSRLVSELSAETTGKILVIHAREGAAVERSALLVTIDQSDARTALDLAQRELAVLAALAAEAKVRQEDAERERERLEGLRKTEVVSQAQLDQARTAASAAVSAAQAAQSRVEAQKALIEQRELVLARCELRAPFQGVVAERYVEVGEWALPGKTMMRLLNTEQLYVRAELDEVDIAEIRPTLPVRVTLDPYKGRKLNGTIVRVDPYVSEEKEQNRTVEIEVELDPRETRELQLKPGISADVEVILRTESDVLRIPALALMEGERVLVVRDGYARVRSVKVGIKNWEYAEILEGLSEGESVIVSLESEKVKDGVPVRVVQESER